MLKIGSRTFNNRLILGTAQYPSPEILKEAIQKSQVEIVTVSLRRHSGTEAERFWKIIQSCHVSILPNTAGCRSVNEAVTTARLARELFQTHWIKLETVGDEYTLQPDPFTLVEAARILVNEGFEVLPFTTEDLVIAEKLVSVGCKILMPWGSPIGSGRGLLNVQSLKTLRSRFPKITLIIDAGIGTPSQAAQTMELGYDAVLLNSAVALSHNPVKMAQAFALSIQAGRVGYEAGLMPPRDFATATTPIIGTPFWHRENFQ